MLHYGVAVTVNQAPIAMLRGSRSEFGQLVQSTGKAAGLGPPLINS